MSDAEDTRFEGRVSIGFMLTVEQFTSNMLYLSLSAVMHELASNPFLLFICYIISMDEISVYM